MDNPWEEDCEIKNEQDELDSETEEDVDFLTRDPLPPKAKRAKIEQKSLPEHVRKAYEHNYDFGVTVNQVFQTLSAGYEAERNAQEVVVSLLKRSTFNLCKKLKNNRSHPDFRSN